MERCAVCKEILWQVGPYHLNRHGIKNQEEYEEKYGKRKVLIEDDLELFLLLETKPTALIRRLDPMVWGVYLNGSSEVAKQGKRNYMVEFCKRWGLEFEVEALPSCRNKYEIEGDVVKLKCYDMVALVDLADLDKVLAAPATWTINKLRNNCVNALINSGPKLQTIYLHRYIMDAPSGMVVDHINGNCLDNRRANLRVCSNKENMENRTRHNSNNTSGYRGVSWDKKAKKYEAYYWDNYKKYSLGFFRTAEEAGKVAAEARKKNLPYSKEARGGSL